MSMTIASLAEHMHPSNGFVAPEWALYAIAAVFFTGACFYFYRLIKPSFVMAVEGYYDWENEVAHGLCMLAMASAMAPAALQLPSTLMAASLFVGGAWFLLRAVTWGLKLPYNKWWYDWGHVGMLFGMFFMFQPVFAGAWFVVVQVLFWIYFSVYSLWYTVKDVSRGKLVNAASDVSHLLMGVVMLLMVIFPGALMPHHHASAPQELPAIQSGQATAAARIGNTIVASDSSFQKEVFAAQEPVIVLFSGGCESCAKEVEIFDEIAGAFPGKAKFVRINKDTCPAAARHFGVKECPRIFVVKNSAVSQVPASVDVTDKDKLRAFIGRILKQQ